MKASFNIKQKDKTKFLEKFFSSENNPFVAGFEEYNSTFIYYSFLLSGDIFFEKNETIIDNEEKIDIIFKLLSINPTWILSDVMNQTILNPVLNEGSFEKLYPNVTFSSKSKFLILFNTYIVGDAPKHLTRFKTLLEKIKIIYLKNESIVNFIKDKSLSIKIYQKVPLQKRLELENSLDSNFICENGYEKFYDTNYGYTWDCRWIFSKKETLENIKKIYFIYQLSDYNEELLSRLYDKIIL